MDFKIGDRVYASDWCEGVIVDMDEEVAHVEFSTSGGGGCLPFTFDELEHVPVTVAKMKYKDQFSNGDARTAIEDLMGDLNYFCFHGSGADDNCSGCCFEGQSPCPLHVFYTELASKL